MATTRIYLPSGASYDASGDSNLTGMTINSAWSGTAPGGITKHRYGWANIPNISKMPPGAASQPATAAVSTSVSSGGFGSAGQWFAMRFYLGPLKPGTVITGSSTLLTEALMGKDSAFVNLWRMCGAVQIRTYANVLSKTMEATGTDLQDSVDMDTTMTTRFDTSTSAATNYTTVANDWILCEVGVDNSVGGFIDPSTRSYNLGDGAASDISSLDSTTVKNGYFDIENDGTLAIAGTGADMIMLLGVGT